MFKINLGKIGEEEAVAFLKSKGYRIAGRNVRTALGELDVVAVQAGVICFVEVRARRGEDRRSEALASVDERKQRRLSRLARSYLKENHLMERKARFDVVTVCFAGEKARIELLKNAFDVSEKYN